MSRLPFLTLAITALGSAAMPAPLLAQSSSAQAYLAQPVPAAPATVLPAEARDFECFVLMQQRRAEIAGATGMSAEQRATLVNNMTIISAYYAGRISHYPGDEATAQFSAAFDRIEQATPEQRGSAATACADFYLSVIQLIDTRGGEAIAARQ